MTEIERREQALQEYRKKLLQHKEIDAKVRTLREQVKVAKKDYDKTEDDLKALQSVGQIIAEVLRQLDEERCELQFIPIVLRLIEAPTSLLRKTDPNHFLSKYTWEIGHHWEMSSVQSL